MLRFYGSLSSTQRDALRQGVRIPVSTLSALQQSYAATVLYANSRFARPQTDPSGYDLIKSLLVSNFVDETDGALDPTELMPSGLPRSAYITSASTDEPIVAPADPFNSLGYLAPTDFAQDETQREQPGNQMDPNNWPSTGLLGQRTDLSITFRLGRDASLTRLLFDVSVPLDAQKVNLAALPRQLRELVNRLKLDYQTSMNPGDAIMVPMPAATNIPPR